MRPATSACFAAPRGEDPPGGGAPGGAHGAPAQSSPSRAPRPPRSRGPCRGQGSSSLEPTQGPRPEATPPHAGPALREGPRARPTSAAPPALGEAGPAARPREASRAPMPPGVGERPAGRGGAAWEQDRRCDRRPACPAETARRRCPLSPGAGALPGAPGPNPPRLASTPRPPGGALAPRSRWRPCGTSRQRCVSTGGGPIEGIAERRPPAGWSAASRAR